MSKLRNRFWETVSLDEMTHDEWEALCDNCGKCCLNKLEDEDTGEVLLTRIACRLLDDQSCHCGQYDIRHQFVPDCIVLSPQNIKDNLYWMPQTCAYKLLWNKEPLFNWHPLISKNPETVHQAGVSIRNCTIPEYAVSEADWEEYIIEEPT